MNMCACFFFFFKQKTAYEVRISDWSSDVCSSDLQVRGDDVWTSIQAAASNASSASLAVTQRASAASCAATILPHRCDNSLIVRPLYSDRKSVVQGKRVSVRVDRGGRRILKKKKKS